MRPLPASTIALAAAAVVLAAVAARGPSGEITRAHLEDDVASTFANLVAVQVARVGRAGDAAALHASAQCRKVAAPRERRGAGDWTCDVAWYVPARYAALRDRYDLHVTPDGCYAASADGEEAHVGGPTITTRDGATMRNLLYAFDGCIAAR
ncbi:MAG TPA: hypothetical protein VGG39_11610 [Polyangiaceae bacterium]